MKGLFDPDAFLWQAVSRLVDLVGISLLWVACAVTVLPLSCGCAAVYQVSVRYIRKGENGAFTGFFRSIRQNFLQSLPLTLAGICVGVFLLWGRDVMAFHGASGPGGTLLYGAYRVAMILPLGVMCWTPALLGRFSFTTPRLLRTALALTLRHLPSTIIMVLLVLESVQLCLSRPILMFIAPSVCALLLSLFAERIFPKYIPQQEEQE